MLVIRRLGRRFISTEQIKKYQQEMVKSNPTGLKEYPKTFEQKMILLNDPKTIQLLEVIEYGVKYKSGKKWLPLLLLGLAAFCYFHEKILPVRIIDRYFMISP